MGKDVTTIQISKTIRDQLKDHGKKGETYDEIIERLLKLTKTMEKRGENK